MKIFYLAKADYMETISASLSAVSIGFWGSFSWGYYFSAGYFAYTRDHEKTVGEPESSRMTLSKQM